MKKVKLILPGLTDVPQPSLGGQTPLEKAKTEALDVLATKGHWHKVEPPKGSIEKAFLELFGLDSQSLHLSKSSLEVYAKTIPFHQRQCAFGYQLISLFDHKVTSLDPNLVSQSELDLLSLELSEAFKDWIQFFPLEEASGVALLNEYFDANSEEKDKKAIEGQNWLDSQPSFFKIKHLYRKLSEMQTFLHNHPVNQLKKELEEPLVNGILFYDIGAPLSAVISKKYYEPFFFYTPSSSSIGLANLLQIHAKQYFYPKINRFEHVVIFLNQLLEIFERKDIVVAQFNDLWQSTKAGNLLEKIKRIEFLDQMLLKPLLSLANEKHFQIELTPLKNGDLCQKELVEGFVPYISYNPQRKKGLEEILSFKESELKKIRGSLRLKSLQRQ